MRGFGQVLKSDPREKPTKLLVTREKKISGTQGKF